ncbi:hypothetical protein D3H65_28810 [Paraflavitalea soli]|uniref:Lipocalin-like domain-containing protein n=1 Tax=Paraflavitalea soli TaxID=2315862 RepID=A0A3B7MTA1_9BACT|nr:hypothetical protein [Paraflavitalea soli]AXY77742.1 hypothetical protein D3H65_28810 [Paraflavitalea soli]
MNLHYTAISKCAGFILATTILVACQTEVKPDVPKTAALPVTGTWKLLSGTLIEKGDTTVTDYTRGQEFIKILNGSHFAFLHHDLSKGKDSAAIYSSGGGSYTLTDSLYTEHLQYCTARQWEGNDFHFVLTLQGDTLTQQGVEKIENLGVNRINIEKYVRVK